MQGTQRCQISDFGFRISEFLPATQQLERVPGGQTGNSKLNTRDLESLR